MSPVNSVEQRAPNIWAIRQISVVSGLVSNGMTLENKIWTPSKTSERSRGMMRYRGLNGSKHAQDHSAFETELTVTSYDFCMGPVLRLLFSDKRAAWAPKNRE